MTNWYCGSVEYTAVAQWAATHVYSAGAIVRQLAAPTAGSERCFRTTAGGISGGSEPSWVTATQGSAQPTDGSVTDWVEVTGQQSFQSSGAWAAPHARLQGAMTTGWAAAGDTIFVSEDHAETQAASYLITSQGSAAASIRVICVNHSGSVPPVSADLRTTATVSSTGTNALAIAGFTYFRGITFNCGTGAGAGNFWLGSGSTGSANTTQSDLFLDTCTIALVATGAGTVGLGAVSANFAGRFRLLNTPINFAGTGQGIQLRGPSVQFIWEGTASGIGGSAVPTILFRQNSLESGGSAIVRGVDLSSLGSSALIDSAIQTVQNISFQDCKLGTSYAVLSSTATFSPQSVVINVDNCDSAASGTNFNFVRARYQGIISPVTNVVVQGGASDGTTQWSHQYVTNANNSVLNPIEGPFVAGWQNITGSPITVTVKTIVNATAALNNNDIWLEIFGLSNAGAPLATFFNNTVADPLASAAAQPTDTSSWSGSAALRANNTLYSLGNVIKVTDSSDLGRIWFCTTGGTSNSSEPAGYQTQVDGQSVTDGTAVFRAGVRQILSVTFTPAVKGVVLVRLKVAKPSITVVADWNLGGVSG